MDAPVASKIIVSFHEHSDGPYFWPQARSKQKVPSSVSEQHPKCKGDITEMVLLTSTFTLTDIKLLLKCINISFQGSLSKPGLMSSLSLCLSALSSSKV